MGYTYTTTDGKLVYVCFGERTGDVYTYTIDNYLKWYQGTVTNNSLIKTTI